MEAPEKIYIHPDLDSIFGIAERSCESEIEYTRTDAFIEKAEKWIKDNGYMYNGEYDGYVKAMAEDFINYMKGK